MNMIDNAIASVAQMSVSFSHEPQKHHRALRDLQDDLFAIKRHIQTLENSRASLLQDILQLEKKLEIMQTHTNKLDEYECCQLPAGTFVYRRRDIKDAHAPYGYICPFCIHQKGIALLQLEYNTTWVVLTCPECNSRFKYGPLTNRLPVRRDKTPRQDIPTP
ncbi:TPA: hypothetical protein ACGQS5_004798 [Serratia liquefaciens]